MSNYNKAIALNPNYAIAYVSRGNLSYKRQDYDRSLANHNAAINLNPNYAPAYNQRGNLYFATRDYERARSDYTAALQLDARLDDARAALAKLPPGAPPTAPNSHC